MNGREKSRIVFHHKSRLPLEELCAGLPAEFHRYLDYCRNLEFEECPDYAFLRSLFTGIATREAIPFDFQFDWNGLWVDRCSVMNYGYTPPPVRTTPLARPCSDPGNAILDIPGGSRVLHARSLDENLLVAPRMGEWQPGACFLLPGEQSSVVSRVEYYSIGASDGLIELRPFSESFAAAP